jgi:inhibitor of KinA
MPVRARRFGGDVRTPACYLRFVHFSPLGDQAITVTLGDAISEAAHRRVRAAVARLTAHRPAALIDIVPAFVSVTVHYDPSAVDAASPFEGMVAHLEEILSGLAANELAPARLVEIPVCYGGVFGPDLEEVARRHDLRPEDVVRIHTDGEYLVYMVGFMPGFAYLGGLAERIATPRRNAPRQAVPAGSVGIGGQQTGVYPIESPGGWNLIGRTPRRIFDPTRTEPSLLSTGDRVKFVSIPRDEFDRWHE